MQVNNTELTKLLQKYADISLINRISAILDWDMNVNLPVKGAEYRSKQSAYMTQLLTQKWHDHELKELSNQLKSITTQDPNEKAIIRNFLRSAKYYYSVPAELIIKKSETVTTAFMVWQDAKKNNDVKSFLPHLNKIVDIELQIADHLGYKNDPYDALLDLFEPELTAAECQKVFTTLQPPITELIKQYAPQSQSTAELTQLKFPRNKQEQFNAWVLSRMQYDLQAGRVDVSTHPFTTDLGLGDVRITTWYKDNDFRDSLTSTMHEAGHGLYEQHINPDFFGSPLEGGTSYGMHESQSRFWENQVGRNPAFLEFMYPKAVEFFPELKQFSVSQFIKFFNTVSPSLIRVESDEVTYNLHIMVRFELEHALLTKKITPDQLPELWNTKMQEYVGITPDSDRNGMLQDVHWSNGYFGYFPSYCLGNVYAAQLTTAMKKSLAVDDLLKKGELAPIGEWLKDSIHVHGSQKTAQELLQEVTGEGLNAQHFIDYITTKCQTIYK